jgi:hypothetical protein
VNGDGFATLVKNKLDLSNQNDFRIIATLYDRDSNVYDIIPYLKGPLNRLKLTYVSRKNKLNLNFPHDYITPKSEMKRKETKEEVVTGKVYNGGPVEMYTEVLLYIDVSNYENHIQMAGTSEYDLVLAHIEVYYIHFMNGINQRYQNSLKNDPDLRLTIGTKNIAVESEFPYWYNNTGIFNGENIEYLDAEEGLYSFTTFMESVNVPFEYDLGAALV